jgi:ankyrin repeat protein
MTIIRVDFELQIFYLCSHQGHAGCVRAALKSPSAISCLSVCNKLGRLPIHTAATKGNWECISAIIEAAPSSVISGLINVADSGGNTALHLATSGGYRDCIKYVRYFLILFSVACIYFFILLFKRKLILFIFFKKNCVL